ncbi:DNA polymerase III subunit chi [Rhodospirillum rubrum]|uniref:DNA polymerase III, chi subunit n=1 Tax=Rhodospirillum rubrum (strain ATCC 11170 / ATH 1.1.1 / DSM 467 / LMG 4362 / NCIMB 8255 / S1) TaxID=269796 RepID=Q2RS95_RHORT|nr:DNA polymerase III subunit chi [Rhodospirillum rubrum]ABC23000.1 DNA polymerase III, chi subunit [Rhodospirillum rubrum ATCC 11170]AEO48729.1 DNA polymerase III subunit chi [Rhodospirillum rubrum F11]MBK5954623.1 DNA polymerase III subunit chi [Rhodospirillum rubrum]QXG78984.1 DNA polymerase III subunit chi [Rhodospirillum rubrum]HAP98776.1 DNA polymerase III subunit chi [Rhodospirillum rubrum]
MSRFDFYHLQRSTLEDALPRLLARVRKGDQRAVVMAGSPERVDGLNSLLWTFDAGSWLPHGTARDGDGADQPVWLTIDEENPNGAEVLVLTDGVWPSDPARFARILLLFDGGDDSAVARARGHWKAMRENGHELHYWQQDERGGWEEKARAAADPGPSKS